MADKWFGYLTAQNLQKCAEVLRNAFEGKKVVVVRVFPRDNYEPKYASGQTVNVEVTERLDFKAITLRSTDGTIIFEATPNQDGVKNYFSVSGMGVLIKTTVRGTKAYVLYVFP